MNIYDDKIIYKSVDYVYRQFHMTGFPIPIKDRVGIRGYIMKDMQGRRYFFVAKRYIYFRKDLPGIVSINKEILEESLERNCLVLLIIEDKNEEGGAMNYVYSIDADKVLSDPLSFDNTFNEQIMCNFRICHLVNMEPTRARGPVEVRVEENAEAEKTTLTRWIK